MAQGNFTQKHCPTFIFSSKIIQYFWLLGWFFDQIFHKRMPPEAVDLVSRLLQYSPNLRCQAVSISNGHRFTIFSPFALFFSLTKTMFWILTRSMLWSILSSTSFVTKTLAFPTDVSFPRYSISKPMVRFRVFFYRTTKPDWNLFYSVLNFWLAVTLQNWKGFRWRFWWSWSQSMPESSVRFLACEFVVITISVETLSY